MSFLLPKLLDLGSAPLCCFLFCHHYPLLASASLSSCLIKISATGWWVSKVALWWTRAHIIKQSKPGSPFSLYVQREGVILAYCLTRQSVTGEEA